MDPIANWDRKDSRTKGYPLDASVSRTSVDSSQPYNDQPPPRRWAAHDSSDNLMASAASMGLRLERNMGQDDEENPRQPTIPRFVGYQERRYSRLHTEPIDREGRRD